MKEAKKTMLILGISSFIGSNLAKTFKDEFKIIGTFCDTPVHVDGVLAIRLNIVAKEEIMRIFSTFKPDIVIYALGFSSVVDAYKARKYNDFVAHSCLYYVVESCQRHKAQLVYLSSALVFSGEDENVVSEADIPNPRTPFGYSKATAELYIQKASTNYIIFRLSTIYGRGLNPRSQTWFEKLQHHFFLGKMLGCDDHMSFGFLDVDYLAAIMKLCFEHSAINRLFQISSSNSSSYFDFAQSYSKIFDADPSYLQRQKWPFPFSGRVRQESQERKRSFLMSVSNIENYLSIKMPTIDESLKFTFEKLGGSLPSTGAKLEKTDLNYL